MRIILLQICVLGLACASWAESNQASWANLNSLQAGQKIQVVDANSKKHSGTFVNVSDTAISFQEIAGEQTIQKQDVRSVKLMKPEHRLRNALIVGGIGAGGGAGIGAASARGCSVQPNSCIGYSSKGVPAAFGAVIGFAGGAAVGALLPSHKMIYRVP